MNNGLACYYSILRFCPYPETDEFVNVGVVLACPSVGFLSFRRTRRRLARVNDFFPELDPKVFSAALQGQEDAMRQHLRAARSDQLLAEFDSARRKDGFFALIRPRETILFFSEPRVILSSEPSESLNQLFEAYVERRFAKSIEYQETQMCDRLEALLKSHALLERFKKNEPVGDDHYKIRFPFVSSRGVGLPAKQAIKALYLDKEEPTEIFRHADSWLNSVRRLRDFHTAPDEFLFVLHPPKGNASAHHDAFRRVVEDFQKEKIPTTMEQDSKAVIHFAAQV